MLLGLAMLPRAACILVITMQIGSFMMSIAARWASLVKVVRRGKPLFAPRLASPTVTEDIPCYRYAVIIALCFGQFYASTKEQRRIHTGMYGERNTKLLDTLVPK